jgi:iron-sulfur cluster assembly accessory protein
MSITVTESAKNQIKKLLLENNSEAFRVSIKAGGCSGFLTHFDFSDKQDKDHLIGFDGGLVVVDPRSMLFLKGSTLNYYSGLNESGFKVENIENLNRSCGCGHSFSVG